MRSRSSSILVPAGHGNAGRVVIAGRSDRPKIVVLSACGWLIAAMASAGCHPFSQYTSPRVEGRVLDAQTREPLSGVEIKRLKHTRNLNPTEPPKGAQLLTQAPAIYTGSDGSFVLDSQRAIGVFRTLFWYSVNLSFEHAGYAGFATNYTPANATNTPSGEPLIKAGDILLVPVAALMPATNSTP